MKRWLIISIVALATLGAGCTKNIAWRAAVLVGQEKNMNVDISGLQNMADQAVHPDSSTLPHGAVDTEP